MFDVFEGTLTEFMMKARSKKHEILDMVIEEVSCQLPFLP